jgi:hypothetical protein
MSAKGPPRYLCGTDLLSLVIYFVANYIHQRNRMLTPEEFEDGMRREISTIPEWHALFQKVGRAPYGEGQADDLVAKIERSKEPYRYEHGKVVLFQGVSEKDAAWMFHMAAQTPHFPHPNVYFYDMLFAEDMRVVGYIDR